MHSNGFLKQCARWVRHRTGVGALPSQQQDWSRNALLTLVETNQTFKENISHGKYYILPLLPEESSFPQSRPPSTASGFWMIFLLLTKMQTAGSIHLISADMTLRNVMLSAHHPESDY